VSELFLRKAGPTGHTYLGAGKARRGGPDDRIVTNVERTLSPKTAGRFCSRSEMPVALARVGLNTVLRSVRKALITIHSGKFNLHNRRRLPDGSSDLLFEALRWARSALPFSPGQTGAGTAQTPGQEEMEMSATSPLSAYP